MKLLYFTFLLVPAFCQAQDQNSPAPPDTQQAQANRSVLEVTPGEKAIKAKDRYEGSGIFHPFARMPKFVIRDQKAIWTSPFRTSKTDAKWWAVWGGATIALVATDKWTVKQLPNSQNQVRLGTYTSNIGAAYSLVPISAGFYFLGSAFHSDHFRETGLLAFETLIDTTIVETVLKAATRRARPLESDGKGHFWDAQGSAWNASFPSGHAINTVALASVLAHEYRHNIAVPIAAYSFAGVVLGARIAARKHFPGDVVAGAAMGWFIGDYVYAKRHNPDVNKNRAISYRVLEHFRLGAAYPTGPSSVVEVPDGTIRTARP